MSHVGNDLNEVSRRSLLKLSGSGTALLLTGSLSTEADRL